jgi:hypothetical protein
MQRSSTRAGRAVLLILAASGLTACDTGGTDTNSTTVRDSAGVIIVANTPAALAAAPAWRLDPTPAVSIGGADSPDDDLALVTSAVRLSDERIVVANGVASEIRYYSPSGDLLASTGRAGEGPGEYRVVWRVCRLGGDSVAVWDVQLRRLSIISPSGTFTRAHAIRSADSPLTVQACTGSARVLIGPEDRYKERDLNQVRRDTLPLLSLHTQSDGIDTLGHFPGEEQYRMHVPPVVLLERAPFGAYTSIAASGTDVLVADNGMGEIRVLDDTGAVQRLIRTGHPAAPVTGADRAAFEESHIDETWRPTYLAAKRAFIAEVPFPRAMPGFGRVIADEDGRIWVSAYSPSHLEGDHALKWTVLDADGAVVATVETPPRFEVMQVGSDWILGVLRDRDDVEHVQLLTIR